MGADRHSITAEVFLSHTPERVWQALTEPDLVAQWWAPGDISPVVGHRFTMHMGAWGAQLCTVLEVDEPHRFRYSFAENVLDTTITWTLTPESQGTRLALEHAGFDPDAPFGETALEGMGTGWPGIVAGIGDVLGRPSAFEARI